MEELKARASERMKGFVNSRMKAIVQRYRKLKEPRYQNEYQQVLTTEDRANGFSIVADDQHGITLSKWGKLVAWFSPEVCGEVVKAFLEVVKNYERKKYGQAGKRIQPIRE